MKNFNIFGVHQKTQVLGGGIHEKPIYRGSCLKRGGAWTVCKFKGGGGGLARIRGGGCFQGGMTQCRLCPHKKNNFALINPDKA